MDTILCGPMFSFLLGLYLGVEGIARSYGSSMSNLLQNLQTAAHSSCTMSHSPQQYLRAPSSPHLCRYWLLCLFLAIPVGVVWGLTVVFFPWWLMMLWPFHVLIGHLCIFCGQMFIQILCLFSIGFFFIWVTGFPYVLFICLLQVPFQIYICKTFLVLCALSYRFLTVFETPKSLFWYTSNWRVSSVACAFGLTSRKPPPDSRSWRLEPVFSCRSFIVWDLNI